VRALAKDSQPDVKLLVRASSDLHRKLAADVGSQLVLESLGLKIFEDLVYRR
jgi:hypothetical protein